MTSRPNSCLGRAKRGSAPGRGGGGGGGGGRVGAGVGGQPRVVAGADRRAQPRAAGERDDGPVVGVVQPHAPAAGGAILPLGGQALKNLGLGSACLPCHPIALLVWTQSLTRAGLQRPAEFADVVFFPSPRRG